MTLLNLRYIVEVAGCGSFSQAAKSLYMSQSALSAAIKDVEEELGIQIFYRTNRGVSLTPDGEDCLKYCREIISRTDYLTNLFQSRNSEYSQFSVSSQRLPFSGRAFRELMDLIAPDAYDFSIRETTTAEVMNNVSSKRSELGVVALLPGQLDLLEKHFSDKGLCFVELAQLDIYVFLRKQHPLAGHKQLGYEDLKDYPIVKYDQGDVPYYFTEETTLIKPIKRKIYVSDRASKAGIIRSSDAFSIGMDLTTFNSDPYFRDKTTELVAVPFGDQQEKASAGYLTRTGHELSDIASTYVELLKTHIGKLVLPGRT